MKTTGSTWKKITSSLLSLAVTMQAGWALTAVRVNAQALIQAWTVGFGTTVTLTTEELASANFHVRSQGDNYVFHCDQDSNINDFTVPKNDLIKIEAGGWAYIYVETDVEAELVFDNSETWSDPRLQVEEGSTLTCNGVSGDGTIINFGTIEYDTFNSADYTDNGLSNYGTVRAKNIVYNNYVPFLNNNSSVIEVTDSLVKGSDSFSGKIVAVNEDTSIKSSGGNFTLELNGYSKKITEAVDSNAIDLVYKENTVTFSAPASVYYGTDYDLTNRIGLTAGYNGTPYLEYSRYNDPAITRTKPTAIGDQYEVRAVAPQYEDYKEGHSSFNMFSIVYLSPAYVSTVGKYYSFSNVIGGKYVDGTVTVVPASGYKIACSAHPSTGFADTLSLSREDVLDNDGNLRDDLTFTFKRNSDLAETDALKVSTMTSSPKFEDLIFDEYEPGIGGEMADGLELSVEDGDTVVADELSFYVYDDNLDSVTVDGKSYTESDFEDGMIEITLNSVVAEPRTVDLTATDKVGKTFELSFTLKHTTVDPSYLTVNVNDYYYVGEDYNPTVSTDSDGDVTYTYRDAKGVRYTDVKPSSAGTYVVRADVSETENYYSAWNTATYSIRKRTPSLRVSVPDTIIGDSYRPSLDTDSDGAPRAVFEYKVKGTPDSTYTETMPSAKGTYTVRATIPETDRYLGGTATSDFSIRVKAASASVSVSDPYAGTEYAPVLTTDSDGRDNAVFEYKAKGAGDESYSTERPGDAGTYVVRATVPETDTYGKITCTSEFNIVYLPEPSVAYSMEGTRGNNDYFVSDVELKAPEGYTISVEFRGEYLSSVPYTDELNVVYLRREEDGALTSAIAVGSRPSIDKEMPSFESSAGSIAKDSVLFVKDITLTASDDNLISLTVNGEPVDLTTEGNVLTLTPGFGIRTFVITAEDKAGNISTIEFTLMAEWLKDRIIPADVILPLVTKEPYNLSSGKWTVNDDKTVYNGDIPIYVNEDGDYTFTSVN